LKHTKIKHTTKTRTKTQTKTSGVVKKIEIAEQKMKERRQRNKQRLEPEKLEINRIEMATETWTKRKVTKIEINFVCKLKEDIFWYQI